MSEEDLDTLRKTVGMLHECTATHRDSVHVTERFQGQTVWDGDVQVFEIEGNPDATICYAWSYGKSASFRQYKAILHAEQVDSPQAAVRAVILEQFRRDRKIEEK